MFLTYSWSVPQDRCPGFRIIGQCGPRGRAGASGAPQCARGLAAKSLADSAQWPQDAYSTPQDAEYRRRLRESVHDIELNELIEHLAEIPLEFEPGSAWNHSVSTDVLGWSIAGAAGVAFADFLRERVLPPLGMVETDLQVSAAKSERMTTAYLLDAGGMPQVVDAGEASAFFKVPRLASGGGGLVSTSCDDLRFCRFLLGGGELEGTRLLEPATFEEMTRNQLPGGRSLARMAPGLFSEPELAVFGFGLAVRIQSSAASSRGELPSCGIAGTEFWVEPIVRLSVVFMTQVTPSTAYALRRELRQRMYGARVGRRVSA